MRCNSHKCNSPRPCSWRKFSVQNDKLSLYVRTQHVPQRAAKSTPAALTTTSTRALNLLVGSKIKTKLILSRPPAPPLSLRRAKSNRAHTYCWCQCAALIQYINAASAAFCVCALPTLCDNECITHVRLCSTFSPGRPNTKNPGVRVLFFFFTSCILLSSYLNNVHNCATQKCLLEWVHRQFTPALLVWKRCGTVWRSRRESIIPHQVGWKVFFCCHFLVLYFSIAKN